MIFVLIGLQGKTSSWITLTVTFPTSLIGHYILIAMNIQTMPPNVCIVQWCAGSSGGRVVYSSCCAPLCFTSVWVQMLPEVSWFSPGTLAFLPLGKACHQNRLPSHQCKLPARLKCPWEDQLISCLLCFCFQWFCRSVICRLHSRVVVKRVNWDQRTFWLIYTVPESFKIIISRIEWFVYDIPGPPWSW